MLPKKKYAPLPLPPAEWYFAVKKGSLLTVFIENW